MNHVRIRIHVQFCSRAKFAFGILPAEIATHGQSPNKIAACKSVREAVDIEHMRCD